MKLIEQSWNEHVAGCDGTEYPYSSAYSGGVFLKRGFKARVITYGLAGESFKFAAGFSDKNSLFIAYTKFRAEFLFQLVESTA